MPKLIDCFLYNNELELLQIRLRLLDPVVEKFVIVWAAETFTGRRKAAHFPSDDPIVAAHAAKIELITIDKLIGHTAWDKENYSRNLLARAADGAAPEDLLLISDVDEIPRPDLLRRLRDAKLGHARVLALDYFNFKFNYQLVHGTQAVWPGPIVCAVRDLSTPQALRDVRWRYMDDPQRCLFDAGWHFSFLTHNDDVTDKLGSYSHQEAEVQQRREAIGGLIRSRTGFHDHIEPASVWAVVDLETYRCPELQRLIAEYPRLLCHDRPDDESALQARTRLAMHRLRHAERRKMLRWFTFPELAGELVRRAKSRLRRRR
jgi:beta-1,4-mannosyl-glycoprotein beta-1,4-N-acetylglucosaminyltransferase